PIEEIFGIHTTANGQSLPLKPLRQIDIAEFAVNRREMADDLPLQFQVGGGLCAVQPAHQVRQCTMILLVLGEIATIGGKCQRSGRSLDSLPKEGLRLRPAPLAAVLFSLSQSGRLGVHRPTFGDHNETTTCDKVVAFYRFNSQLQIYSEQEV